MTLTWAAVELAGLGDVPFAQPCPLADGRPDPVHVVLGQDGVEEDAPGVRSRQRLSRGWEAPALRLLPAVGQRMLKTAGLIKASGPVSQ